MSKLKKFVAGALAAVVCTTSFSAPAPATADAATYCCHTIYRVSSTRIKSQDAGSCSVIVYPASSYIGGYGGTGAIYDRSRKCTPEYVTYLDDYACYKCSYTYTGYHTVLVHDH